MSTKRRIDRLRISRPCRVSWDQMVGDDCARFCDVCSRTVYNFSSMDEADIETCIRDNDGDVCAQMRRTDSGKILTRQPKKPRRVQWSLFSMMSLITAMAALLGASRFLPSQVPPPVEDDHWFGEPMGGDVEIPDDFFAE